jgi:hypothetical protein
MDFDDAEAANLTALKNGFGITSQPWTVRELTHLLFLRELRRVGRRWSDADDRVDESDGLRVPAVPSSRRENADPSDGRVTLLTLFRSMAPPNATLDLLRPSVPPRPDAAGDSDRKGG